MLWVFMFMACAQDAKRLDAYAEAVCDLHDTCETLSAFGYGDLQDCIAQATQLGQSYAEDKETLETCLDELYSTDCDALYDSTTLPSCLPVESQ